MNRWIILAHEGDAHTAIGPFTSEDAAEEFRAEEVEPKLASERSQFLDGGELARVVPLQSTDEYLGSATPTEEAVRS